MRTMKDSGIEWIGEIPATWKCYSLTQLFGQVKCKNTGMFENNLLSLSYGRIINKDINTTNGLLPESFESYNIVEPGDIVLRLTDLQNDHTSLRVGLSTQRGIITSAYLTIRNESKNLSRFLYYQLHAFDICKGLYGMGAGVRQGLNWDGVKLLKMVVPSVVEQQMIVDTLDRKCAEIDAVIERTKATIEEYKKLKQSIITEAVTKGIRGNRPMKDSGIAWVPQIAADWHISRIGLHYDVILGKMLCDRQLQDDYTLEDYFCAANVHFDGVATQGLKKMWFSPVEKETYRVNIGDLLVVEGGAGAGGAAIVTELINPTYIQNSIMIVRGKHSQTNRYLRYWIECLVKKGYVDVVCNKATIPHFTKDKLATMPIPVLDETEMVEIADYLDEKCLQLDALIARKTALLEEMESYKKSVIYEYVTGKKEVC